MSASSRDGAWWRPWLDGAGLVAILVVRSPVGGVWIWSWWALPIIGLARALVDPPRPGRMIRWWLGKVFLAAFLSIIFGPFSTKFVAAVAACLLAEGPWTPPLTSGPRRQVFRWARAAFALFYVEVYLTLAAGIGVRQPLWRWLSLTGDPWEDFLLWCGAVVLASATFGWAGKASRALHRFRDARDHALRLKLAPHFIFNTLNTLKAQIERDPREASETVNRLSALYRQLLEQTERPTVPLREELAFVEAYLGIERIRLGERLRVKVSVPESLEALEVPTLGLQVLVENAVKHGIAPREEGGEVRIRAYMDRYDVRKLWLAVENPAAPRVETGAALEAGTGTGLETLRARLRRPGDLKTEERNGHFLAEFHWAVEPIVA